jgi:hypothetical protein
MAGVPYTFQTASTAIPLSQLDTNFQTPITIGATSMNLGQVVTTISGLTLTNVTISSGNVTVNSVTGNATIVGGTINNTSLYNVSIINVATTFPNNFLANSSVTYGNATVALGGSISAIGNLALNNVTVNSVSTPITVAQGGTGLTTLTSNSVLVGNATGSVAFVAPGANGNYLTSNGTAWVSVTPGATTGNVTYGNTTVALGGTSSNIGNLTLFNANVATYTSPTSNYQSTLGFKNRFINGNMVISQYNGASSVTPTGAAYLIDRWQVIPSQSSKLSFQQNAGSVTPPAGYINYLGATSLSNYALIASDYFLVTQKIEGLNTADLGWGTANAKTVTVSFWVRSSLTGTFGFVVRNSTGNRVYPASYTISAANTWEQKSVTIAGDTSGTWLTDNTIGVELDFGLGVASNISNTAGTWTTGGLGVTGAVSVVGTNTATWYVTGVQLEVGLTATNFDYRPYGTELMLCQRYYNKLGFTSTGWIISGTQSQASIGFPPMRTSPSVTDIGSTIQYGPGGSQTTTAISTGVITTTSVFFNQTIGGGMTTNAASTHYGTLGLSSEL